MVKKFFTFSLLAAFFLTAFAGERVLIRIGQDGKQDAIPLKTGEKARDVIERLEKSSASLSKVTSAAGLIDTMRYYTSNSQLATNFGWTHQDVAFQWYLPTAGGVVKEFWWYNYQARGNIKKGTIRAWEANSSLLTLPSNSVDGTGRMGYYDKTDDGDGLVTPFKSEATNPTFQPGNGSVAAVQFDPLGTESAWLPGGLQQTLDSAKWQGVKMDDWGDSLKVTAGYPFGFTLMNDTKASDIPVGGTDERMEILSKSADGAPYHSIKFYEIRTAAANKPGWQIRAYEWGMYVVVEYTTDRPPIVTPNAYSTTLSTAARVITAKITDDNPGGGSAGVDKAYMHYKIGSLAAYDSVLMTAVGSDYSGSTSTTATGDTVYWYVSAWDVNNNYTKSPVRNYKIFKKANNFLLIYNNAQYSIGTADLLYTSSATGFFKHDRWSGPNDGTGELPQLLAQFDNVVVADGAFPSRDVYPALHDWLKTGTAQAKKNLFFTSQDYGCYITNSCADTTFVAGSFEFDFLGILTLGPQDLPPSKKEFQLVPVVDPVNATYTKFNTDSATTMWYDAVFELGFTDQWQDALTPRTATGVKGLYTNVAGTQTYGLKYNGATFNTMFVGFDAGGVQFRSDTSLAAASDPKYNWIVDVEAMSVAFFKTVTSVQPVGDAVPGTFSLGQNYPNPFNPTTSIEYNVPVRSNVEISIFNILGQKVATVVNDLHDAGQHRAVWNGKDSFGKQVATGIYFYQMRAGSFEQVKKMMLMK